MNAWTEAVQRMWPDGGSGRELMFVPNATRPRLLVPAGVPAAAAGALRRYSHDLGTAQRLTRAMAATAVRAGLADRLLRDRIRVGGESVEDRLGELLGRDVVVCVGLGTERANRKPVLHVLSPGGESLAFVKVGDTATAQELIDREAVALAALARRTLCALRVPRVLHHGEWRGLGLLVLSPLRTRALPVRRGAPVLAMSELTGRTSRRTLATSRFWARFGDVPLTDPKQRARLDAVVARIEDAHGEDELDFGAWHGDWTPWNMAWHRGRVNLWDWERYDPEVPVGLDLLHYRLQTTGGVRVHPDAALLRPLQAPGRTAAITVELYLLELARRYLLAAQGPLGEPLREQAARLLDLLEDLEDTA